MLKVIINEMMNELNIPLGVKGYRFLKEAVVICVNQYNKDIYVTKELYPKVARLYRTKPECVERAIRNAISKSWSTGSSVAQTKIFGRCFPCKTPTNKEFIAALTESIVLEISVAKENAEEANVIAISV